MTAGFFMPAYTGHSDADKLEYARNLVIRIDTAVVALVDVFRNTSGAPLPGATGPNVLSAREKGRWNRCRLIQFDFGTMSEGLAMIKDSMPGGPMLQRAAANLAEAFEGLVATGECDLISSMIDSPDRWSPWQDNYETRARAFYKDWYTQLRALHEADRGFARALLPVMPAGHQFRVPDAMPPNPPTAGSVR